MKIFRNKEEIRKALLDVSSIDQRERPKVIEALHNQLDHGGVSRKEFREVVSDLRKNHEISDIDAKNLLRLLK